MQEMKFLGLVEAANSKVGPGSKLTRNCEESRMRLNTKTQTETEK